VKRVLFILPVLLIAAQPAWLLGQDGKLQQIRDEVRHHKDEPPAPADSGHSSPSSSNDDDDDSFVGVLLGETFKGLCWLSVESLFGLPKAALNDTDEQGYFLSRPYAHDMPGFMWLRQSELEQMPAFKARPWSAQLFVEESNDFHGINRINADLRLDSLSRFGVQAAWNYVTERLDSGGHDELWLGDANVTYRFAQSETCQFHAGLGFRWLADRCSSDFGVNFMYGADFFPAKPLVVSTRLDLGNLGSAFVVHGRITTGAIYKHCELFGGYDILRIGTVNLQGPVLGLRYWF
jgi:hypothetical protein